jgi:hypothetical protein
MSSAKNSKTTQALPRNGKADAQGVFVGLSSLHARNVVLIYKPTM